MEELQHDEVPQRAQRAVSRKHLAILVGKAILGLAGWLLLYLCLDAIARWVTYDLLRLAHGSHLGAFGLHPLSLGASLTADSAHKTLPVLTGGAMLHIGFAEDGINPLFDHPTAKAAMALFGSTSPSYLVMLSLDIARAWMAAHGEASFNTLRARADEIKEYCSKAGLFTPKDALFDPVRITLDTASIGVSGPDASQLLRDHGIAAEMNDDRHLVLLPSPFNSEEDFSKLWGFLRSLRPSKSLPMAKSEIERPKKNIELREAADADSETADIMRAAGRLAAEAKCPCPPGVPLVMPGELISNQLAKELKSYGVLSIKVVK
jgi:arginine/lysine/ornithine decarboxylase